MKTNRLDNSIKEKFKNRTLEPSISAWERLSAQLDEQPPQKKKGWLFYIGYAASILLLISAGFYFFSPDNVEKPIKQIIVEQTIDTTTIRNNIDKIFTNVSVENAIVKKDNLENKEEKIEKRSKNIESREERKEVREQINKTNFVTDYNESQKKNSIVVAKNETKENPAIISVEKEQSIKNQLNTVKNPTIKVSAEDLLFAVTHSSLEVKAYYAKHDVTREQVLNTIKSELKKSNLKVNPATILAEVESTISDDFFRNNFLKSLKRRVTDIASAIASRND